MESRRLILVPIQYEVIQFIFILACTKNHKYPGIIKKNMNHLLKIILAVLLLLCLAPMPYGYYQLVRIVAMIAFAIMAYQYYEKENVPLAFTFAGLALLFQPFVKVALGRTLWNIVDAIVAVVIIVLVALDLKKKE